MNLSEFISGLLRHGSVVVAAEVKGFSDEDLAATLLILRKFHEMDALDLPGKAPGLDPEAGMWGAMFVYRTAQLILLRELGEEAVQSLLPEFQGNTGPEAVYSVDLCLRKLPELLNMASGLAPGDPLVERLQKAAHRWPFSSVGVELKEEVALRPVLDHDSLRAAYVDRIIAARDRQRALEPTVNSLIQQALGDYKDQFWPDFEALEYKS